MIIINLFVCLEYEVKNYVLIVLDSCCRNIIILGDVHWRCISEIYAMGVLMTRVHSLLFSSPLLPFIVDDSVDLMVVTRVVDNSLEYSIIKS